MNSVDVRMSDSFKLDEMGRFALFIARRCSARCWREERALRYVTVTVILRLLEVCSKFADMTKFVGMSFH